MLWFYLTGLAILIGAEMNAEIEHLSPYGKDPGEKRKGQRRIIGAAAARAYAASPEVAHAAIVSDEGPNCTLDAPAPKQTHQPRPSELLMGGLVLVPLAYLKIRERLGGKDQRPDGNGSATSRATMHPGGADRPSPSTRASHPKSGEPAPGDSRRS
jgi:hypothetical protein